MEAVLTWWVSVPAALPALEEWLAEQAPSLPPVAADVLCAAHGHALGAVRAFAAPQHEVLAIRTLQLLCAAYVLRGAVRALIGACTVAPVQRKCA